jgi:hypothetical protein
MREEIKQERARRQRAFLPKPAKALNFKALISGVKAAEIVSGSLDEGQFHVKPQFKNLKTHATNARLYAD